MNNASPKKEGRWKRQSNKEEDRQKKEDVAYHIGKIKWQQLAVDPSKEPPRAVAAAAADAVPTSCERQSNSCPEPPQGPEHTCSVSPT